MHLTHNNGRKENEQELREGSNVKLGIRKASYITYLGQTGKEPMLNVGLRPRVVGAVFQKQKWADAEKPSWAKVDIFHNQWNTCNLLEFISWL